MALGKNAFTWEGTMAFAFEDLKVYRDSLTWVEEAHQIVKSLGTNCPRSIRDQLTRAALSIPLTIGPENWARKLGESSKE